MGYFKAEEIQKFVFPASELVLGGIIPDDKYEAWIALVRIIELVFGCGRSGITSDALQTLENLIWRHNILTEESEGTKSCVISLHNLIHLIDDIKRFSCPDNYWCYTFERAVHKYVERSSNPGPSEAGWLGRLKPPHFFTTFYNFIHYKHTCNHDSLRAFL